ncbi:uncharacterized protein [Drosophila virilis]|nr:uncharacterized protein LOC6631528 isoform X2 [Drosophila virilis]
MQAQYQIPLSTSPQQPKGVNLLQLHALQWLYAHAQQNMPANMPAHCCQGAGQPPFNYAQPNMNYFAPPHNGQAQQPYLNFHPQAGVGGIRQLYNHAQSASQNYAQPFNIGQPPSMSFVPPAPCGLMQQSFSPGQPNLYQSCAVQPPYGYAPHNIAYMPPTSTPAQTQCAQMQQPYCGDVQSMHFMPPPCGPDPGSPLCNEPFGNVSQFEPGQPSGKHVYVNGALYNTELLEPPLDSFNSAGDPEYPAHPSLENVSHDEETVDTEDGYDPLDDAMPSIYGIRFYNPNYGPEGAIPPRFKRKMYNRNANINAWLSSKQPEGGMPRFQDPCAMFHGPNENAMGRNNRGKQEAGQELKDAATTAAQHFIASMSPNSKVKRRQGRSRPRGFTQSFGIVAPIKRNNSTAKDNLLAAKNVLSLFDKKSPPIRKWDDFDPDRGNINVDWPLPNDVNKTGPNNKSQTKRNIFSKEPTDHYFN